MPPLSELPKLLGASAATWTFTLLWAAFCFPGVYALLSGAEQWAITLNLMGAVLMSTVLGPLTITFWIWDRRDNKASKNS